MTSNKSYVMSKKYLKVPGTSKHYTPAKPCGPVNTRLLLYIAAGRCRSQLWSKFRSARERRVGISRWITTNDVGAASTRLRWHGRANTFV